MTSPPKIKWPSGGKVASGKVGDDLATAAPPPGGEPGRWRSVNVAPTPGGGEVKVAK